MSRIKKILMKRDGYSAEEADQAIKETRELILSSNPYDADEIIAEELGLEPDYLMDLLCI